MNRLCKLLSALALTSAMAMPCMAQNVAKKFTYQGFLENGGQPYTGTATFDIYLFNALTGGSSRDRAAINANVPVTDGVFSITVDFGDNDNSGQPVYNGTPMYLEIVAVLPGAPTAVLSPRQLIQPAPYAVTALGLPGVNTVNGSVGIGTASPSAKLHVADSNFPTAVVQSTSTIGSWLQLINSSVGGRNWSLISTGSGNGEGAGKLLFSDQTGGGPRLVLDADGDVGIGTNTPAAKLHVVGNIRYASDASANPARTFEITSGGAIDLVANSDIYMNSRGARKHILFNTDAAAGNIGIGTVNPSEKLHVNGNVRARVIIIEGGADVAESYDVAAAGDAKPIPGMVVSIDPDRVGKLRMAAKAYDRTVAGIISGADGVAPGLILGQKGTVADGEFPIANVGRVWCYVDADANGAVLPGDLLTTSATLGHAMKVTDHAISGGAILGKAMSRLDSGKGLVLVLVTLQ